MLLLPWKIRFAVSQISADPERLQIFNSWNSAADTCWSRINVLLCGACVYVCVRACLRVARCLFVCCGGGGVTACFGEGLYCSPHWQPDVLLEQMVPTENMNTAMPLDGTGNLSSPHFPRFPFFFLLSSFFIPPFFFE